MTEAELEALRASHERMGEIGADSAVGRVVALLKNLGFSDELLGRPVKDLSGGWRVRVGLAVRSTEHMFAYSCNRDHPQGVAAVSHPGLRTRRRSSGPHNMDYDPT